MIGEKYTLRVSKKDNGVKIFNNYDENNWRVLNVHYQNYEDAVYLQIKLKPLVDLLNELYKENEKLKQEIQKLTVQKLEIRKWINDKISDLEKKYEFGQTEYKGCPMHNIQFGINILKELLEYSEEEE